MSVVSSLTNRIFLASALLLALAMGMVILRVNVSVATQAEADLTAGLGEAATLVDRLGRTQFDDFVVKAQLIADLPVLKGAASTDHVPTVLPIAEEYEAKIGADLFVVTGRGDRVLASVGRIKPDPEAAAGLLAACRSSRDGTTFWPVEGGVVHAVAVSLTPLATFIVGVSLDRDQAERMKAVTHSDIVYLVGRRVVTSTLEDRRTADLTAALAAGDVSTVWLSGEQFISRLHPLGPLEDPGAPSALVLRSRTEHLRFLSQLRWQIVLTGLAAVLVATVLGYGIARTVTRPIRGLTATMREIAATGDLDRPAPAPGPWDDEDARVLTSTFTHLTGSLDRFRREAAQRERLSSLGRLSTVVAHEIRNPLMIIKSAVRTLRRDPAPAVADVASSIDEEVARLNRVVSDVLDYAKPIEFAVSETDLAEACRDAVKAVRASAEDVPVEVTVPPAPARVATDGDRLRTVLVNLLDNAQQAVRALGRGPAALTPVRLGLSRQASGWRIEVEDRGTGIATDDLPRMFEPFYTTRRGGSGLGLAIARNVVEGLGGTIGVRSQVGVGTTVWIDLPDRPAAAGVHA